MDTKISLQSNYFVRERNHFLRVVHKFDLKIVPYHHNNFPRLTVLNRSQPLSASLSLSQPLSASLNRSQPLSTDIPHV
jgi:hypothetical protein